MIIGISIFLVAVAFAVTGSFTFWQITEWYEFYKAIVLFIGGYVAMIALWWIFIAVYGKIVSLFEKPKKVNKFSRFLLCQGMRYIDDLAGIRVKVNGKDKLPRNQRFLLVQNHASKFDPMIVNGYFEKYDIAFITKPSNMKIPLAKNLMPRLFYQPIVREDPIQSLGVMRNSIELIENNVTSIGVYPEGTRHQDGQIGEFHEGVFNICLKAKCPLVVITTSNTDKIHKRAPFRWTKVNLNVIKVYTPEELQDKTALALSNEVRELMLKDLGA